MSLTDKLIIECISDGLNVSITYQKINDHSVEIYKGYQTNYQSIFYTDGHLTSKKAIKKALKFLKETKNN